MSGFDAKKTHADDLHKCPTEKLTLVTDDTILPMIEVEGLSSLQGK